MYKVLITRTAEKQLKKLPKKIQLKIAAVIFSLEIDPQPYGTKKLTGYDSCYRIRVGNYRIIYEIDGKQVIITVLKVGHRKDIYS